MKRGPEAPEYISKLPVYVPGKPVDEVRRELGITEEIVKLASNENPLGTSPLALSAIQTALGEINRYPDGGGYYLRRAIAEQHGLRLDQVVLGNGSVDIIEMAARSYLADGDEAIYSQQSFVMYPVAIASVNGRGIGIPATPGRRHDVDAIAKAVGPNTKLIYIANPSNPTGTFIGRSDLTRLFQNIPETVLVVVDQAYHEYVDRPEYPNALDDLNAGRNVLVLRTFSKIYGLAGIRIGYGLSSQEVIETLNLVRSPFNTSHIAQSAALAAMEDSDWVDRCREENARERSYLESEMARRSIRFTPSVTNFILVEFRRDIQELFVAFQKRGVIIRPVTGPGLENCARVSIGTRKENARFLVALDELN